MINRRQIVVEFFSMYISLAGPIYISKSCKYAQLIVSVCLILYSHVLQLIIISLFILANSSLHLLK